MSVFEHLPGAHSDSWEWQLRGACRSYVRGHVKVLADGH